MQVGAGHYTFSKVLPGSPIMVVYSQGEGQVGTLGPENISLVSQTQISELEGP